MKIINVQQGSPEWIAARLGIPSASNFDKIITPAKLKPSSSQDIYLSQLVAEWFLRAPMDDARSGFMDRGVELEPEAAKFYSFDTDRDVIEVGFCLTDDGAAGCSPDRLVGKDGLLEIKCPGAVQHMDYLLHGGLRDKYWMQVQGQLWVTGRRWCDLLSYHPTIPNVTDRIVPDADVQAALSREIPAFCVKLAAAKARLVGDRPEPVTVSAGADTEHVF